MKFTDVLSGLAVIIIGGIVFGIVLAVLVYPPEYVYRVLVWQDSDAFDWQKFPSHPLSAAPTPHYFEPAPDPRVEELLQQLSGAEDWNGFLEANGTQAFIVIKEDTIGADQTGAAVTVEFTNAARAHAGTGAAATPSAGP